MYIEKEITNDRGERELSIDFGKNMMGLTDELIIIGKRIEKLSKEHRVLIKDTFIDTTDDVYQFTFLLLDK